VRRLQLALSAKEKVERDFATLEMFRADGTISEEQYGRMKGEYANQLVRATEEVQAARDDLERAVIELKRRMEDQNSELQKLKANHERGVIPLGTYDRAEAAIRTEETRTRDEMSRLGRLRNAVTSEQAGGYIDFKPKRPSVFAADRSLGNQIETSWGNATLSRYFAPIRSGSELSAAPMRAILPVASFVMFISLFLRWAGSGLGSVRGTVSGGTTATGIIVVLFSVAAWFLAHPKVRGGIHLFLGALAILVALLTWIPDEASRYFGISLREGFYLYMVGACLIGLSGVASLRER